MDTQPRFILRFIEQQRRQAGMRTIARGRAAESEGVAPKADRNDRPRQPCDEPDSKR